MLKPNISVQTHDFDLAHEYHCLSQNTNSGALVLFVGLVRDMLSLDKPSLWLEHYPKMTDKILTTLVDKVTQRWNLNAIRIIHRIGELQPGDQIVLVGVSAEHRGDAFAACECLMDHLKSLAPFWKREGSTWVKARESDVARLKAWNLLDEDDLLPL